MALTITWNDGVNSPTVFTFADEVVSSLNQYRATITAANPITGMATPIYPTVMEFMVGILAQYGVSPAVNAFPPTAIATAKQNLTAAQNALATAVAAALQGAIQTP
jgi:hypothetical protein